MEGTESAELLWACVIHSGGQRPFYWSQKDLFSQRWVDVRTVSPGIITCNVCIVLQTSLNRNGTIQWNIHIQTMTSLFGNCHEILSTTIYLEANDQKAGAFCVVHDWIFSDRDIIRYWFRLKRTVCIKICWCFSRAGIDSCELLVVLHWDPLGIRPERRKTVLSLAQREYCHLIHPCSIELNLTCAFWT